MSLHGHQSSNFKQIRSDFTLCSETIVDYSGYSRIQDQVRLLERNAGFLKGVKSVYLDRIHEQVGVLH